MKKIILTLSGLVFVAVIAAIIIALVTWSRAPDVLANTLSKKLNVSVNIDDIRLHWHKIDVEEVVIGNPPNTLLSKAFSCKLISVMAPFARYLDKQVVIDKIEIDNVYLGLEFDSATSAKGNWTRIMENLRKSQDTTAPKSKERSVLIRSLVLTNIDVDVVYRKEGGKIQRLPRIAKIELTNVSSEGGLPMDQVMNSVLGQMLKSVFEKQNLKNMLDNLLQQGGPVQKYLGPFQGLWNANPSEMNRPLA